MAMEPEDINTLLDQRAARLQDRAACWSWDHNTWSDVSWSDWKQRRDVLATWMLSLGVAAGDEVLLCARNRFEWLLVDTAAQRINAVPVYLPPNTDPEQISQLHEARRFPLAFVEGPHQIEALLDRGAPSEPLARIVYFEARSVGAEGELVLDQVAGWPVDERLISFVELLDFELTELQPDLEGVEDVEGLPTGVAFTAGTHHEPRPFHLLEGSMLKAGRALGMAVQLASTDVVMITLPLHHVAARNLVAACIQAGCVAVYLSDDAALIDHMQELHPTVVAARSHVFERLYSRVNANAGAASPFRRAVFGWAMSTGREASESRVEGQSYGTWGAVKMALANRLVFRQLHDLFGGRLRYFIATGGGLLPKASRFFDAAGVLILEGYAVAEAGGFTHINRSDSYRFGSVGQPLEGVSTAILDGRIHVETPWMSGPWPADAGELTALPAPLDTGDIGRIQDGWLSVDGRTDEVLVLEDKAEVLAGPIQRALQSDALIEHAVILGAGRPFVTALITLDEVKVVRWAEDHGIHETFAELTQHREIFSMVDGLVTAVNAGLRPQEQIKKFAILERGLRASRRELTTMLEVRRNVLQERFAAVIDSFYAAQF